MVNLNRSLQIVVILFLYYKYDLMKYNDTFYSKNASASSPSHHDVRAQQLVEEITSNQTISQPTTLPYSKSSPLLVNKNDILYRYNMSTSPIIIEEYKLVMITVDKTGSTVSLILYIHNII